MPDDQAMAEAWFILVDGKEYGPADLDTLREWKADGRVLPANPARMVDVDPAAVAGSAKEGSASVADSAKEALWVTAAEIPGLFDVDPAVSAAEGLPSASLHIPRNFAQILGETFRIYGRGFFQFLYLTLLVLLPSVCAQLSGSGFSPASASNPDLATAVAALFTLCMIGLSLAAWPVFIIGIQILTAEFMAGKRPNIFGISGEILKFWPRVAALCIIVYGVFALLSLFALGIAGMILIGGSSPLLVLLALALLGVQVWLFGRFYVNVLFWQQFAVLEDSDVATALRKSKELARSGRQLPWYQRPMWRGVFIASLWCAFILALNLGPEWQLMRQYFHQIMTSTDPQTMLETLRAGSQSQGFHIAGFALGLLQTLLRPLVGIAFVVLYFENKTSS